MATKWNVEKLDDPLTFLDDGSNYRQVMVVDPGVCRIWFESRHRSVDGMPMPQWHGIWAVFSLPWTLDAKAMSEAIAEGALDDALDELTRYYRVEWDGSNNVGRWMNPDVDEWTDLDAFDRERDRYLTAEYAIQNWLDQWEGTLGDGAGIWDAADWFGVNTTEELGITAGSTDEDVARIARELDKDARKDNVIIEGTENYLLMLRDNLREEDEDGEHVDA